MGFFIFKICVKIFFFDFIEKYCLHFGSVRDLQSLLPESYEQTFSTLRECPQPTQTDFVYLSE